MRVFRLCSLIKWGQLSQFKASCATLNYWKKAERKKEKKQLQKPPTIFFNFECMETYVISRKTTQLLSMPNFLEAHRPFSSISHYEKVEHLKTFKRFNAFWIIHRSNFLKIGIFWWSAWVSVFSFFQDIFNESDISQWQL